ncbi:hypothetical protein GCM10010840_30680 [Deinococcus aerolatus]|uniref:Response regulatory domain-containing protein n=1 Tax=Deinococcus aerolatus TaxID=522487 RepID=A0ABQ2GFB7_9DEIO|nr:response regulator [Deinococcus aerolatus]GGL90510.1 hypothetical protein GCM10010840_30680 [Deinococcus aerolatus]
MTRVLLVEDHRADVMLLQDTLEFAGMNWTVEDVPTFEAAARCWQATPFDLLLLDLDLPDGLGLELLTRALRLAAGVPVVVLSGLEDPRLAATALQMGAAGYVIKGLEAAEHLRRIIGPSTATRR